MRLKRVAALCKAAKTVLLIDLPDGDQWIGDGASVYAAQDLPVMEPENALGMFDISESDRSKWDARRIYAPEALCFDDATLDERPVEGMGLYFLDRELELLPIRTSRGLAFLNRSYLAPLADDMPNLTLFERYDKDGKLYIAAKAGLILRALLAPVTKINEHFVDKLREVMRMGEVALILNSLPDTAAIDDETGEITETA